MSQLEGIDSQFSDLMRETKKKKNIRFPSARHDTFQGVELGQETIEPHKEIVAFRKCF